MEISLYYYFLKKSKNFSIDDEQLSAYIEEIPELPEKHKNALALIIMHHFYLENPGAKCRGIPWNGRIPNGKKGLLITDELPEALLKIIGYYLSKVFS